MCGRRRSSRALRLSGWVDRCSALLPEAKYDPAQCTQPVLGPLTDGDVRNLHRLSPFLEGRQWAIAAVTCRSSAAAYLLCCCDYRSELNFFDQANAHIFVAHILPFLPPAGAGIPRLSLPTRLFLDHRFCSYFNHHSYPSGHHSSFTTCHSVLWSQLRSVYLHPDITVPHHHLLCQLYRRQSPRNPSSHPPVTPPSRPACLCCHSSARRWDIRDGIGAADGGRRRRCW